MKIKKLFVRILIAAALGLCAGIAMEYSTAGLKFPIFLIIGILAGVFIEFVIEILRGALTIAREDLRKLKKTVLRILIATSIGLLAGIILEFAAVWAAFPFFLILGVLLSAAAGITIEAIRYHRLMRNAFFEGKEFGLEKLPVRTADLIRQVIKKMHYRKEVLSEVMAELTAHFEDELKDCQTDEGIQQKARQLVDDFGDTKLLAILLRRAKKRCRPLWRTVVARTFQAVGALILFFIVYAVWFSTGKPTLSVDYLALLNQMNRPEVRNEDNAWPHYEKAIELYVQPDQRILKLAGNRRKDFKKRLYFSDLDKNIQDMIRKWLKENESNWNDLEPSQKRLFERCFNEGLVPFVCPEIPVYLRGKIPVYPRGNSSRRYRVFDEAVRDILRQIERPQYSRDELMPEYEMMMEMEMMGGYGYDRGDKRDIKLNPDNALDSEINSVFGAYLPEELKKIRSGLEAGVIKKWIDSPPVVVTSLLDYLWPFEKKLVVKWVQNNEAAWREFVTGSSKSYCYREYQYRNEEQEKFLWNISYSHLNQMKMFSRLGIWRSRVNIDKGQIQQSIYNCLAIARAGSHWQGRGIIAEQLVGMAMGRMANDEILHVLSAQILSIDQLKRLQNQLSQLYPRGYPLIDMEGRRIMFMDSVQRFFTDGGPGGGHLIPQKDGSFRYIYNDILEITDDVPVGKQFVKNAALTSVCLFHARRDATVEMGEQIYDRQAKIARMSPYERRQLDIRSTEQDILSMNGFRYALLYYLMPASERISELVYQDKTMHEALIVISAVQRYQLDNGQYPEALNELIDAGYLKELPIDLYSDKPLIYKKTGDNFVLYSIGRNFKDDVGKIIEENGNVQKWATDKDGDAVFWPVVNLRN